MERMKERKNNNNPKKKQKKKKQQQQQTNKQTNKQTKKKNQPKIVGVVVDGRVIHPRLSLRVYGVVPSYCCYLCFLAPRSPGGRKGAIASVNTVWQFKDYACFHLLRCSSFLLWLSGLNLSVVFSVFVFSFPPFLILLFKPLKRQADQCA